MKNKKNKKRMAAAMMAGVMLATVGVTDITANASTIGTEKYMNNKITVTSQAKDTSGYSYVSYPVKTSLQITCKVYVKRSKTVALSSSYTGNMNNTTGLGCSVPIAQKDKNSGRKTYYVRTSAKVSGHTFVNSKTKKSYVEDYR